MPNLTAIGCCALVVDAMARFLTRSQAPASGSAEARVAAPVLERTPA